MWAANCRNTFSVTGGWHLIVLGEVTNLIVSKEDCVLEKPHNV